MMTNPHERPLNTLDHTATTEECLEAYAWELQTRITKIKRTWKQSSARCYCDDLTKAEACDVCKMDAAIYGKGVRR